uniref:Uncharacterized protein n=1 Tax=Prolemur simus TaxID=1328070 RepID=A0A8C9AFB6_PROSS
MSVKWSELIMKSSVPAVVAGIIAIYDPVVEVLITDSLNGDISFSRSFFPAGQWPECGTKWPAGSFAVSIVGDSGHCLEARLFVGMFLILIFVLCGPYGVCLRQPLSFAFVTQNIYKQKIYK